MIWLSARQSRSNLVGLCVVLAVATGAFLVATWMMRTTWNDNHLGICLRPENAGCNFDVYTAYGSREHELDFGLYAFTLIAPLVVSSLLVVPLLVQDHEFGTFGLILTQGVGWGRWAAVKVAFGVVLGAATMGVFSVGTMSWAVDVLGPTAQWDRFDYYPLALIGYGAFASALACAASVLTRRTIPSIAFSSGAFLLVRLAIEVGARRHYLPPVAERGMKNVSSGWLYGYLYRNRGGADVSVPSPVEPSYLSQHGITTYTLLQPGYRFWDFQAIEVAIFLLLTSIAIAVSIVVLRRRMP